MFQKKKKNVDFIFERKKLKENIEDGKMLSIQ